MLEGISNSSKPITDIYDPYRKRGNQVNQFGSLLNKELDETRESANQDLSNRVAALNSGEAMQKTDVTGAQYIARISAKQEMEPAAATTAFANITAAEKAYFDSIRPSFYDDERYLQSLKDYDYRLSLLNPYNLPRTASGFQLVTWPQPGKSVSTDMAKPPTFTSADGVIIRTDYTISGEVKTYIPVTEWRLVNGGGDSAVGKVYSQQLPWGFRCYFDRGGGPPVHLGYEAGKFTGKQKEFLARVESVNMQDLIARIENNFFTNKAK